MRRTDAIALILAAGVIIAPPLSIGHALAAASTTTLQKPSPPVAVADVVQSTIRHTEDGLKAGRYDWPTARAGLTKILGDLQTRSPGDPSLGTLRAYIARGDQTYKK
jgi:hypothetical protein